MAKSKTNDLPAYKSLDSNPLRPDLLIAGTASLDHTDKAISVWEMSESAFNNDQGLQQEKSNKRFRGQVSYIGAKSYIECTGGINQLKWLGTN